MKALLFVSAAMLVLGCQDPQRPAPNATATIAVPAAQPSKNQEQAPIPVSSDTNTNTVAVCDPTGQLGDMPKDNVAAAIADGYYLADGERCGTPSTQCVGAEECQTFLEEHGYDIGESGADGVLGPATASAWADCWEDGVCHSETMPTSISRTKTALDLERSGQ